MIRALVTRIFRDFIFYAYSSGNLVMSHFNLHLFVKRRIEIKGQPVEIIIISHHFGRIGRILSVMKRRSTLMQFGEKFYLSS